MTRAVCGNASTLPLRQSGTAVRLLAGCWRHWDAGTGMKAPMRPKRAHSRPERTYLGFWSGSNIVDLESFCDPGQAATANRRQVEMLSFPYRDDGHRAAIHVFY